MKEKKILGVISLNNNNNTKAESKSSEKKTKIHSIFSNGKRGSQIKILEPVASGVLEK
jgi:hypothetical protein